MAVMEIAVEIGTSNTSLYLKGCGIVLREPTAIAFTGDGKARRIRATGRAARDMIGKTPEKTVVISPVSDGFISDADAASELLKDYLFKIMPEFAFFPPKIKAVLGVPTGLTLEERSLYEEVCLGAGISEVTMIENILLSGIGIDLPVSAAKGGLVVNIGGGVTEIAAISLSGVISGCGVSIGGNMMDRALTDYVAGRYNLKIGPNTARKLKHGIGSLYFNDTSIADAEGVDIRTKTPASETFTASDVREAVLPYYMRIADAVENIINMCPPEIASDLYRTGIYSVGGGSRIPGLSETLSKRLELPVFVPEDPSYAAILGAGKLLGNPELLADIQGQR